MSGFHLLPLSVFISVQISSVRRVEGPWSLSFSSLSIYSSGISWRRGTLSRAPGQGSGWRKSSAAWPGVWRWSPGGQWGCVLRRAGHKLVFMKTILTIFVIFAQGACLFAIDPANEGTGPGWKPWTPPWVWKEDSIPPPPSPHPTTSEGHRGPTGSGWLVTATSPLALQDPEGETEGPPRKRKQSQPCESAPGFHSQGDRERHRGSSHLCNHRPIETKINGQVINTYANVTCSEGSGSVSAQKSRVHLRTVLF